MDSETAFVIAIIVVFIVIGIFVFIYACCVTEEKLKNATKKKASEKKPTPAAPAPPAPTPAPVPPSSGSEAKRPAPAQPMPSPSGIEHKQNPEIVLTVQSPTNQPALPAYLPSPPSAVDLNLTAKSALTNAQSHVNGKNHIALAVTPDRHPSLPKASESAYTVHL
ncbi:unnamed protein product [Ixodes hexagonus]